MDKSDEFGQIFFNIIEESEDYKLIFEYESNEIYNTGNLKFICIAGICTFTFTMESVEAIAAAIDIHPTYNYDNNTDMVTLTWNDPSNSVDNVTLDVELIGPSRTIICHSNSNNYSGQYSCNISSYYGTITVKLKEYGSLTTPISRYITHLSITDLIDLPTFDRNDTTFWIGGVIATISIAGALISPVLAIIFAIFGLIAVSYLNFNVMITLAFVIPAVIIGIIISILMRNG
jgi:hypothetical protein